MNGQQLRDSDRLTKLGHVMRATSLDELTNLWNLWGGDEKVYRRRPGKMTDLVGIYGAGGCGRVVMPLVRSMPRLQDSRLVFIDDMPASARVNGQQVLTFDEFQADAKVTKAAVVLAVAAGMTRSRLDARCGESSIPVMSVRADNVIIMDDVKIEDGSVISPFVTLTSNIRIGRCFHANLYSYVEHDCVIGSYVTFGPGVQCNGNVSIGDYAYVGAGAVIKQGVSIGAGAVVGMGAVVTRDVCPGITVVGNPARSMNKG